MHGEAALPRKLCWTFYTEVLFHRVPARGRLLIGGDSSGFHETASAGKHHLAFIASERFADAVHVCVVLVP